MGLPCTGGRGRHEREALADRCAFSSDEMSLFGLAQFMCVAVSGELRQVWAPKLARRAQMSALLPYTASDKPVKSVKVGVWQWLTIPNSAAGFCIDDSAFSHAACSRCSHYLRTHKGKEPNHCKLRQREDDRFFVFLFCSVCIHVNKTNQHIGQNV